MYPGIVELRQQLDKYKGTVYDDNGEILCEYRIFNDSVIDVEFGENNKLPITVYSEDDILIAKQKVLICVAFNLFESAYSLALFNNLFHWMDIQKDFFSL